MTAVLAPDPAWVTSLRRPAVRMEQERADVCDLVLLGILTGAWTRFTDDVRRGLALAGRPDEAVSSPDVRAAATAFRYARGLVSAAEFTTWLRERALTLTELSDALTRQLHEERAGDDAGDRAGDAELAAVLRVEAFCRGTLDWLASAATDRLAAADRLGQRAPAAPDPERVQAALRDALGQTAAGLPEFGEAELRRRLERLVAVDAALAQLREEVASPEEVGQCLASHRLDWLRCSGDELAVAELGAAREARLLVRDDGLALDAVAERAGTPLQSRSAYLEDLPPEAVAAFAAAAPGEVVGPWLQDARWHVLVLKEKTAPTAADATLRRRAAEELLEVVLERHKAGRSERLCVL